MPMCTQIDRELVQLLPIPMLTLGDDDVSESKEADDDPCAPEIQLGGLNTTDPRFSGYKGYTGCLSSESKFI